MPPHLKPIIWMASGALIGGSLCLLSPLMGAEKKPKNRVPKTAAPSENTSSAASSTSASDDAHKRKLLNEAAKRAMVRLQAAKAKEDAERNANPTLKPSPENSPIANFNPMDDSIGGTVRHGGITYRPLPKQADDLPQDIREHVQTVFLRTDPQATATATTNHAAQEPAPLPVADSAMLEKRVDQIERKLDEVLTLLKTQQSRQNKKKKQS